MGISLEALSHHWGEEVLWVARFGEKHRDYGDPYTGTCIIIRKNDIAHLIAHAGIRITHSERKDLAGILHDLGLSKVSWERRRNNGSTHVAKQSL